MRFKMPQNQDYQIVCSHLKSLNIHFSDQWLSKSINSLKSSYPGISTNDLRKRVYEEWLSTNLRDIKSASFPSNLSSHRVITLSGSYAVQVESMINSARSCYTELQRIQNSGKGVEATEKSDEDANSKRCLTFVLCDGVQEVQAMEHQSIPTIKLNDPSFLPGFKMLIKGPVICRKGMLLLKQENVKVYGGKVDSLCESNNIVKVLRTKLNMTADNNEENTCQNTVQYEHPSSKHEQPREIKQNPVVENNTSNKNDVSELFSEDDDLLLSLSFDKCLEEESKNNIGQNMETEEIHFQHPKKPRISICDDVIMDECNIKQVSKKESPSVSKNYQSLSGSWDSFSNKKAKLDNELLQRANTSNHEKDIEIIHLSDCDFNDFDDDDMFIDSDNDMYKSSFFSQKMSNTCINQTSGKFTQTKMSSYFKKSETPIFPSQPAKKQKKIVTSQPFVYLKQIAKTVVKKPTAFTIKAVILTLKSKISIKHDEFALKALICDGSYSVQVCFSSDILENILQYSPCEVSSMISDRTKNSAISEKIKVIFSAAQDKLLSMNCLMKIKFFCDGSLPLVYELEEIAMEHLNALKARC